MQIISLMILDSSNCSLSSRHISTTVHLKSSSSAPHRELQQLFFPLLPACQHGAWESRQGSDPKLWEICQAPSHGGLQNFWQHFVNKRWKKASEKEDASLKITGEDAPLRTHSSHSQSWHWGWQILKWPTRNRSGSISASLPQRKAWQERTPRPDLPSPRPLGWQPQRHPEPSAPRTPPAAPQPHTCPPSYHVTSPFGVKK